MATRRTLQRIHAAAPTHDEATEAGRSLRTRLPRRGQARYVPGDRDPLEILAEQNSDRVQTLVPLRMGRMLASPFAFFRGTAAMMTADLARGPSTGIRVVSCGDAHIANFGLFASPMRTMVFDLNDFDEAAVAPWEWDLKRLVTSVVIGGRESGLAERECHRAAVAAAGAYRTTLAEMMTFTVLDRYYFRADTDALRRSLPRKTQGMVDRVTRDARRRTSDAFVRKITTLAPDGTLLISEHPPVLTHVAGATEAIVARLFEEYRGTVSADIAHLLSQFTLTDLVMRVVGVGSVGTRCYVLILTGPHQESLALQVKEAQPSVLQRYGGMDAGRAEGPEGADARVGPGYRGEGDRVISNQRILQAVSDPFLGYLSFDGRDYYVRQFRDMKGSIDISRLGRTEFSRYVRECGSLLARAHAQSATAPMVAGYLGRSDRFDRAVANWSVAYADQSLADYRRLQDAVAAGTIEVLDAR